VPLPVALLALSLSLAVTSALIAAILTRLAGENMPRACLAGGAALVAVFGVLVAAIGVVAK
jgi:hypothetical protein